ncbi:olfactory receptor 11L1-like [Python bivittatus]|uniref:Olfactory receptor n=1 Tax=Python bivittatus TaxID=176946 RepID=A0A9F2R6R7_PYTBI|nr:olfactory receptor 11L1-like [Python bivittatus]
MVAAGPKRNSNGSCGFRFGLDSWTQKVKGRCGELGEKAAGQMFTELQRNETVITEFILLGFGNLHGLQSILFVIFLAIYMITLSGNILILVAVSTNRGLHTPMYFFLVNFSFLEIWYTTSIIPKMLRTILTSHEAISFSACIAQFYFFGSMAVIECYLLAVMSYDRYLAICNPLRYTAIMNIKICLQMAAGSWISGFLTSIAPIVLTFSLPFCASNEIDHFFCDLAPVIKLSCSDPYVAEITTFVLASMVTIGPFLLTLTSYVNIISTILKIPSAQGKQKAFSTCSSHLIVVTLFYGTLGTIYAAPSAKQSPVLNKLFSLLYTVITPMINPMIYSLRNKDVKEALRKLICKNSCCPSINNIVDQKTMFKETPMEIAADN